MSETQSLLTEEKPSKPWLFQPGNNANPAGRPKGSRAKLDQAFVDALFQDFKEGGKDAIRKCREEKPDVYLNVIAKVVPKQVDVTADPAVADLAAGLHAVADFLGSFAAEASGPDLAGLVPSGPVLSADSRSQAH